MVMISEELLYSVDIVFCCVTACMQLRMQLMLHNRTPASLGHHMCHQRRQLIELTRQLFALLTLRLCTSIGHRARMIDRLWATDTFRPWLILNTDSS